MKIIFATNNAHKVLEIRAVLPQEVAVVSLNEAGIDIDIPEPHPTLEENAAEKAGTIYRLTGLDCFSEDTGLEVYSLDMQPGVRSARYAGDQKDFGKNIDLLLQNLQGQTDRRARFRTVICLMLEGRPHYFEGTCEGIITEQRSGTSGFGYDPVFIPDGSNRSFGEMTMEEKSRYSHRARAVAKLVAFLNKLVVQG